MTDVEKMRPALSVLLVTDQYETVRLVVSCFAAQTACDRIEMVIVIPSEKASQVPVGELTMFQGVKVESVESIHPMPAARAVALRASTAPVVFIGETHSFPHPGFAEAIIAAHEGPWDVVVPGLGNANPATPQSWAAFILDYGYWLSELSASPIANGPTWNTSYKRELLTDLGEKLDTALSSGDEVPHALRARRARVYFEPSAVIDHTNVEASGWVDERFLSGLVVGANRARRWSQARRAFYFFAMPLVPFVLLYRAGSAIRLLLNENKLPRGSLAAIAAGAIIRTIGEAVGYVAGIGPEAEQRMEHYELHKLRFASRLAGAVAVFA
jgi:hypothetical protein